MSIDADVGVGSRRLRTFNERAPRDLRACPHPPPQPNL